MKLTISAIALAFATMAGPSLAASHAASAPMAGKATAQQGKMASCNKDAGEKKGDERKAFMKECLSAKPAAATSQQNKMTMCNKDAGEKKLAGDPRKAFMKECLSKKG